jgi:hypothetical protein
MISVNALNLASVLLLRAAHAGVRQDRCGAEISVNQMALTN